MRRKGVTHEDNIKLLVRELEGDGIGRYALNTLSSYMFKPKDWKKPDITAQYPRGMPVKSILIKMADASYELNPSKHIDGWQLIHATTTLKFYKKGHKIIVAIRGTADGRDVYADMKIANGNLEGSSRFKEDLKVMEEVNSEYPTSTNTYYGVGHSLGGAILDLFIEKGYISAGVSYNPAVQKQAFNSGQNYRIYMENDPLYNLIGQYSKIGEVRKQKKVSILDPIGAVQSVKAHTLDNFVGGKQKEPKSQEMKKMEEEMLDRLIMMRGRQGQRQFREEELQNPEGLQRFRDALEEWNVLQAALPEGDIGDPPPTIVVRNPQGQGMLGEGIIDDVKHIFNPATKYNNKSTATLKQYGDCKIEKLAIVRTPLSNRIETALKVISLGRFNSKNYGFDKLFHTGLIASVVCENGERKAVVIEKNEVLNITTSFKMNEKSESLMITLPSKYDLTLNQFMQTAEKSVSKKTFFQYDAFKNNCQDFMRILLSANGLYNTTYDKFIRQDLTKLLAKNKIVGKFAKKVTDLAGVVSRIRGQGLEGCLCDEDCICD